MAEASGFDGSMSLPMMMAMLTAGQGNQPSGISNYVPRHLNPNFNTGGGGLFGAIAGMGPMGQSLGMLGMTAGYGFMPDLMQRLQANSNVDPIALRQQTTMQQAMMGYTSLTGQQIASTLGLGDKAGAALSGILPFVAQLPGAQELISGLTPNNITGMGAQAMAHTAMMMDGSGTLRRGNLDSLERARARLTERNGLRNASFMNGFSQDEFAEIGTFAMDQGFDVEDIDRTALREDRRRAVMERKFKGRSVDSLSASELTDLDFETGQDVKSEIQMRATGRASGVIRSVMDSMGVDRNTAMQFAQQTGMTANTQGDVDNIKRAMRELEGFSKAAQMGGQEIMNLAKALQAQNGGGTLFNTAVASMMGLTSRFASTAGREMGADARGNGDATSQGIAGVQEGFMKSGYMDLMINMGRLDSGFKAKMQGMMKSGDGKGLRDMLHEAMLGRGVNAKLAAQAGVMNLNATERAAFTDEMTADVGIDAMNASILGIVGAEEETRAAAGDPAMKAYLAGDDAKKDAFAMFAADQFSDEKIKALGYSVDEARAYKSATGAGQRGRRIQSSRMGQLAMRKSEHVRKSIAANRVLVESTRRRHQDELAGQGLIPSIVKGKIGSVADAIEASGYAYSAEEAAFMNTFDSQDKDAFVEAGQMRADALNVLRDNKSSEDDKKKATDKLRAAVGTISGFGYDERTKEVRDILHMPGEEAIKGGDIKGAAGSGADKAETGTPAPNGAAAKGGSQEVMVKTDARLEIDLKINGQPLPLTDFAGKASQNSGYREIVVNGTAIGGGK